MYRALSPAAPHLNHFVFILITILVCCDPVLVFGVIRTPSSSAESSINGGGGIGSYFSLFGQPPPSTSLLPSSTTQALISAQFRANADYKDSAASSVSGGAEDEDQFGGLSKYMAASETTYSPSVSKIRLNRYNQAGFYNPYPSHVFPPSLLVHPYDYNLLMRDPDSAPDAYPYYDRERARDFGRERDREKGMQSAYSSNNHYRDGYYGGGGGGGGGGGYREEYRSGSSGSGGGSDYAAMGSDHGGWGWGKEHTSKVTTNAIGLLGLLGLLSLLSNVLLLLTTTTTTTTAAMGGRRRRKRSVGADGNNVEGEEETREEKSERIFMRVLPHLTPIAHAKNGLIPVDCTFHGVCMANKILVEELGINGRLAGQRISAAVGKLFEKEGMDDVSTASSLKKSETPSLNSVSAYLDFNVVGLHGRSGKNCEKTYPACKIQVAPKLPFVIKMNDLPKIISDISRFSNKAKEKIPMNL